MKISLWKNGFVTFLLAVVMVFSSIPLDLMTMAYATEVNSQTEGNYVENIEIYTTAAATEHLRGYEFSKQQKEYTVEFPDTRAGLAPFIITIPDGYTGGNANEAKLYCKFKLDGSEIKLNNKAIQFPLWEKTTRLYQALNLAAGKIKNEGSTLVISVGTVDANKEFESVDEYTYHIKKLPTLNNINGMKVTANGSQVNLVPTYSTQNNPYETNYTAVIGDVENVSLSLKATSNDTEIYADNEKLEDPVSNTYTKEITISGTEQAKVINIELKGKSGINNNYTLNLCRKNFAPVISSQSESLTTDKGGTGESLFVEVENNDGGTDEYQWYKGTNKTVVTGAEESSYRPSQEFAGTETYYCAITRTVDGARFVTWSEPMQYTVNRNVPTAPTFSGKPYILGNAGSSIYVENDSPQIAIRVLEKNDAPIEGLPYQLTIYKTDENSNEGGEKVESCTATKTGMTYSEGYSEYCFELPSQEGVGTWYYYVKVEVSDGTQTATRVSEPLKITFKSVTEVVKKLEGSGSEEDPFLIKNQNDLEYVKELVEGTNGTLYNFSGQTLALENDLVLDENWKPIGCLKEGKTKEENGKNLLPFSGTIDGKNYTLSVGSKPLFNYVRKATIKNLNLYGTHILGYGLVDNYTVDYGETGIYVNDPVRLRTVDIENVTVKSGTKILKAGFIGGYASGVNQINIRNCTIESGVVIGDDGTWGDLGDTSYGYGFISESFDHRDNIGSFAGAFNGTITNSVSYATVYGRKNVGGLVGMKGQSMGSCSILNSSFQGEIIATGDKVGGIVGAGYISSSAQGTPTVEIHNCYVNANIQGNDKIGGLIGSEEGHEKFNDTGDSYGIKGANSISDSYFYGNIEAGEDASSIGGILGYVHDFSKKNGEATNFYLDNCGAKSGIGGAVEGTMTGVDKYAAAATKAEFADGTVLTKLNASSTSYQNWEVKKGAKYPTTTDKPVVTSLSIEGDYKTEYVLGEALDLTGIEVYANWSNKDKTKLEIGTDSSKENVVTYSGYNANTRGLQTITFQYKAVQATIGVKVLKQDNPNSPKTINVKFTLYGDKIHNSDNDNDVHTLQTGGLTSWYTNESYTVGVNATVWDVLQEVQKAHSKEIKFNNKGNYIDYLYYDSTRSGKFDSTTLLGEFTNGKMSGWMYTLNGTHPLLGIEEQFLNNGDRIVWHYTDDYTKEEGSDKWTDGGTTEEVKKVTTDTKTGTVTTPTETKVTEKTNADGTKEKTATVTVSADNQTEIIKQATDKKSAEIVLEVASTQAAGAQNVQLQLNVSFVKNISDKTDAALTVNTENGTVSLDQNTIKTVLDEAKGTTITLDVNKVANPTEVQKKAAGESGQILSLTVKSGDKTISDFKTGKVTVTVAISAALQNKRVAAIHIAENGKIEQMPGKSRDVNGKKCYEFTTSHFSDFALVDADELGLETEDEVDAVALVAKLTPVARSAKTAKGYIKVQANFDKSDKAIISELQDAGYTVKYRFYRSTKKAASYKSALTKKAATYTNTSGKKGTKYYYKVQVRVYDEGGKLVAKTALKQCKYACRTWSK